MSKFEHFECDRCGACCRSLIVEADYLDCLREPKLFTINPGLTRKHIEQGGVVVLLDPATMECPLLGTTTGTDGKETTYCQIHPTRPNECVAVEAGDAKCQQARAMKGLSLLCDKYGNPPSRQALEESCDHYELEIEEWFPNADLDPR